MQLSSANFKDGEFLTLDHVMAERYGFGCNGGNRSPQLTWSGAPDGTRSFALTVFDPDAPTGSGFWHWVVANIPVNVTSLELDAGNPAGGKMPAGAVTVRNDAGTREYAGPCPPQGDHPHRYFFTIFAVGAEQLAVNADTTPAVVGFQLHFNSLDKAELVGLFKH
ncbi:MAG: YbhB/YbcL family Raf kinase inhibitor-like protein [Chloroflexi bacterium]|nr:YbhB/YbcL family Raf kinase inhibitor-like protein [Chloroflexota bacterium]